MEDLSCSVIGYKKLH